MHSRNSRRGFSLVQLIVVAGVIVLMMAFLAPAVGKVREAAARTHSINNLKQIGIAVQGFHDTFGTLPPAVGKLGNQEGPVHFHILLYIEQQAVFNRGQGASWNHGIDAIVIPTYVDPRDTSAPTPVYKQWLATTNYAANYLVFLEGKTKLGQIPDGTSNTIMMATRYQMCKGQPMAWAYSEYHTWAPIVGYYNMAAPQMMPGSLSECDLHGPQGFHRTTLVGFCDGAVRTISPQVDATMWSYFLMPDDGNAVNFD